MLRGYRFDRMELAGSLGDLGTLLPLAMGMIMVNGLDATGLFACVGLLYIVGGLYYRVPIAVQPMKVISAYAIVTAATQPQITAAGWLMAAALLFLGFTGLVDTVSRLIPKPVVRGVQLSTGILLMAKGAGFVAGTSAFQQSQGMAEPFLAFQHLGPVPVGIVLGVILGAAALLLLDNRRFPAGLVVVGAGALSGLLLGAAKGLGQLSPGLHLPPILPFGFPGGVDFTFALFALVLPQLPMTIGNAVVANRDLSFEYFGDEGRRVTDRAVREYGFCQRAGRAGGRNAALSRGGRACGALPFRGQNRRLQPAHRRGVPAVGATLRGRNHPHPAADAHGRARSAARVCGGAARPGGSGHAPAQRVLRGAAHGWGGFGL